MENLLDGVSQLILPLMAYNMSSYSMMANVFLLILVFEIIDRMFIKDLLDRLQERFKDYKK